jgi:hypothetical protein
MLAPGQRGRPGEEFVTHLVVDTDALRVTAQSMRGLTRATTDLGGRGGVAMSYVPAVGLMGPAEALDSFLSNWVYGVGWIGAQAHGLADVLESTAVAFETVESQLCNAIGNSRSVWPSPGLTHCTPMPEPTRPAPAAKWGLLASFTAPVGPQLSQARHAGELIPGDPEQVADLARLLTQFADALLDGLTMFRGGGLGGWTGETATLVLDQASQLMARVTKAANAFDKAATAVRVYSGVHTEARAQATRALTLWQAAERESEAFRGLIPGELSPPGTVEDPGLPGMAQAARLLAGAREAWEAAGKLLIAALREAEVGAPDDPGNVAGVIRWVSSFGSGFVEGTVGMAEGMGQLAALGYRLSVVNALTNPDDYGQAWAGVAAAAKYVKENPKQVLAAAIDLKTLKENPAKWAGQLAPEVLLTILTVGAAGSSRFVGATKKIRNAADTIDFRQRHNIPIHRRLDEGQIEQYLRAQNIDPESTVGQAAGGQLQPPYGTPDQWLSRPLQEGDRIVVINGSEYAAIISPDITRSAREFHEMFQIPATREVGSDGAVSQPSLPSSVEVFEVRGGDLEAAQATVLGNTQFGPGGAMKAFIPDINDALRARRLESVDTLEFDADTTVGSFEDPSYRAVDPTLSERALDPAEERRDGQTDTLRHEAKRAALGAVASGVYERMRTEEQLARLQEAQAREGAR